MTHYDFTTEELEKELERRKKEEEQKTIPIPKISNINMEPLIKICIDHINNLDNGNTSDSDQAYIYETAIECVFGKDIWPWVRSKKSC